MTGVVRAVQVTPSVLLNTVPLAPTATNVPLPYVMPRKSAEIPERVTGAQVKPSGLSSKVPAAPTATSTVEAAPSRPQVDVLAAYRQRLTALLAGHQEYPRVAALRGWEGEVRLRLRVARKGNLLGVQLDHSSGFDVLDQHAVAMLEALASLPPLPEALEANEIQVVVPINYKLKKAT